MYVLKNMDIRFVSNVSPSLKAAEAEADVAGCQDRCRWFPGSNRWDVLAGQPTKSSGAWTATHARHRSQTRRPSIRVRTASRTSGP